MPPRIENYQGREQSFVKHLFLNKYLEAAAYKLFQGRSRTFNFVDAFAGPWRLEDTAEYSDASFAQAIETLETVRRKLIEIGKPNLRIRFRFCERNPEAAAELQQFAEQKTEFDIEVFLDHSRTTSPGCAMHVATASPSPSSIQPAGTSSRARFLSSFAGSMASFSSTLWPRK